MAVLIRDRVPYTLPGETLKAELKAISESGYSFRDIERGGNKLPPEKFLEFVSKQGGCWHVTEADLSLRQKRLLAATREYYAHWVKWGYCDA